MTNKQANQKKKVNKMIRRRFLQLLAAAPLCGSLDVLTQKRPIRCNKSGHYDCYECARLPPIGELWSKVNLARQISWEHLWDGKDFYYRVHFKYVTFTHRDWVFVVKPISV